MWLGWEEPDGGGIYTRDHLDPSFGYMVYKSQITDLQKLLESIHLAWAFAFKVPQKDYVAHVGDYLLEQGYISLDGNRSDVMFEFERVNPESTKRILHQQILASVVAAYTGYLKAILSFILPANVTSYPKTIKIDLKDAALAADLDDLIVRSSIPEITALGFSDYPSLKRRCVELQIYPESANRDLKMIERLIAKRNQALHFHPGSEFLKSGKLRQNSTVSEREMWASLRGFSRVVNGIERRAMKKYRVWTGFYMLERFAKASGAWVDE